MFECYLFPVCVSHALRLLSRASGCSSFVEDLLHSFDVFLCSCQGNPVCVGVGETGVTDSTLQDCETKA